ncbi:MAG TPA: hypothetical protein VHQ42_07505 [Candidatus Limnocylindria bacterium]|nr:hypothetical protein [Candidatus Limnocylindria bacterium]
MRWPWRHRRGSLPLTTPIERVDPATLEVLELDAAGHRLGTPPTQPREIPEISYGRAARDPTGLAGIWEALERDVA